MANDVNPLRDDGDSVQSRPVGGRIAHATGALLAAVGTVLLASCAGVPERVRSTPVVTPSATAATIGLEAAKLAEKEIGVAYRYGGASPQGFDCSGLVYFVYHSLGVNVPRTALAQHQAATPVPQKELRPGDLVFFYTSVDHVGIYLGDHQFIHAPSSGKTVTKGSLNEPYFQLSFAGGGRLVNQ
jgi:cell wall-associated NlpC family hydrolase